jgi:hypothetical protein
VNEEKGVWRGLEGEGSRGITNFFFNLFPVIEGQADRQTDRQTYRQADRHCQRDRQACT